MQEDEQVLDTTISEVENIETPEPSGSQNQTESDDKEKNFANLRKKYQQEQREKRELLKRLEDLERAVRPAPEPDQSEDEILTKKDLNKLLQEERQRNFKTILRQEYKDYDDVMTDENIYLLEEEAPEIAAAIVEIKDRVKGGAAAYKAIKKLLKQNSVEKDIEINKKAMQKQAEKPTSPAAFDKRPIAKAARYTEDDYAALWEETQRYARNA